MAKDKTKCYRISIDKAVLMVNLKKISQHVLLAQETRLATSHAKYPLRRVEMKYFTRGANRSDLSEPNLINGILPRKIVIGLVETDAFFCF